MNTVSAKIMLMNGDLDEKLAYLYACPIEKAALHRERLINAIEKFEELFGVSRATLRQAISDLCNDGFLNRVQGKGTFVTENSGYGNDPTEIWEHNLPGTSHRILSCVEKDGLTKKSALLKMDASETFTVFSYLHCVKARNDEPYNLCVSYFPKSRFPQIEKHLFADTVYATFRDIYYVTIAYAESEFHIVNLSKEKADYLGVKTNSPCIRIEKVYYDRLNHA